MTAPQPTKLIISLQFFSPKYDINAAIKCSYKPHGRLPSPHSKLTPRHAAADRNITESMLSGKVHYPIT